MATRSLPWLDQSGRVSPLKSVVFASLFAPGAWIAFAYAADLLGPRPLNEAIHQIGLWTIRLLFISLAVTPVRQILSWPGLVLTRRMIGVGAFCYGAVHLGLYMADQMFDLAKVASEIVLRIYLTIGFVALLGLSALAATSTDGMLRRLGGRRWRRLHRLVYPIALLAVIHHFMQTKLNVYEPTVMAGFLLWLMAYRVVAWTRPDGRVPVLHLAVLAPAIGLLTALGEAAYYRLVVGVDPTLVLAADFSLAGGLRPAWIVAGAAAVAAGLGALRALLRAPRRRLRPA